MGILLVWKDNNLTEEGHRIYRSTSPMDPQNLPAPIATVGPDVQKYEDGDMVPGTTYYYRVGAFVSSMEKVSDELEVVAQEIDVPVTGLRVHYTMSNVSGSTLLDEQGTRNGTIYGAVVETDPGLGASLGFDGVDDRVDCGPHPLGATAKPFSVSMFVNGPTNGTWSHAVICNNEDKIGNGMFHMGEANNGQWTVSVDGEWSAGITGVPVSAGPAHLVVVWDGAEMIGYVNAVEVYRVAKTSFVNWSSTKRITFGQVAASITNNDRYFPGNLRDFMLYGRALNSGEVYAIYRNLR